MSSAGAASRAAGPTSSARAAASRKNGARSRGPKTAGGKARSARNALKHGLRAEKYMALLDEDWGEFAKLETALVAELAPESALQSVLARRVARAAWRLIRADRLNAEGFAVRSYAAASPGLALIRDGNGTRSIETLIRYRGAAMAEFTRALRTLKALQAEAAAAVERTAGATRVLEACPQRPAAPAIARPRPKEPGRRSIDEYVMPEQPEAGRTLHELAAYRMPNEPETRGDPDDYVMAKAPGNPSGADTGQASRGGPPELSRRR